MCIALRRATRQGSHSLSMASSTNGRLRCIIAAVEGAPREASPPSSTWKSLASRTQKAGGCWLCIGWWRARRRAAMHKVQHALPDARSEERPSTRVAQIHPRAQVPPQGRPLPCWRQVCIARRRARGHSSSHPEEAGAKPARRQRHGPTRRQSAAIRAGDHGACAPWERPSALGRTRPSTRWCTRQGGKAALAGRYSSIHVLIYGNMLDLDL